MPIPPPERKWWPGWDSNPQNPRSERGTYARFRHRAVLVRAEGLEPSWGALARQDLGLPPAANSGMPALFFKEHGGG